MHAIQEDSSSSDARVIRNETLRVRARRVHLQRECQMLEMALVELEEENADMDAAEQVALHDIAMSEQDLLRCLVGYAVYGMAESYTKHTDDNNSTKYVVETGTSKEISEGDAVATICDLIDKYKQTQDALNHYMQKELEAFCEEVRQARSAQTVLKRNLRNSEAEVETDLKDKAQSDTIAVEIDLLREMTAEVNQAIDGTLLECGSALFL